MKLVALREVRYAGVNHVPGTDTAEFDATDRDARLLKATGKVADAYSVKQALPKHQSDLPLAPVTGEADVVKASEADENQDGGTKPRRQYRRRDMTAEG